MMCILAFLTQPYHKCTGHIVVNEGCTNSTYCSDDTHGNKT